MKRTARGALLAVVAVLDLALFVFLVGGLGSELRRAAYTNRAMLALIVAMVVLAIGLLAAAMWLAARGSKDGPPEERHE